MQDYTHGMSRAAFPAGSQEADRARRHLTDPDLALGIERARMKVPSVGESNSEILQCLIG